MTRKTSRRPVAVVLSAALTLSSCAATQGRIQSGPDAAQAPAATAALYEFVQGLPVGSPIRVERLHGPTLRGTLLKATPETLVVQSRTRIPEPPVEVPVTEIVRVTLEKSNGGSVAKAIGVGAAAGAGAALGVFLILLAIFAD